MPRFIALRKTPGTQALGLAALSTGDKRQQLAKAASSLEPASSLLELGLRQLRPEERAPGVHYGFHWLGHVGACVVHASSEQQVDQAQQVLAPAYHIMPTQPLAATLQPRQVSDHKVVEVALDLIRPGQFGARRSLDLESLAELATSIRKEGRVLQPVLLRHHPAGGYEVVAGLRRVEAARRAGRRHIAAIVLEVSDLEARRLALVENLQREDLNPVDEVEGVLALLHVELSGVSSYQPDAEDLGEVARLLMRLKNDRERGTSTVPREQVQVVEQVFKSIGRGGWYSFACYRLPLMRMPEDLLRAVRSGKLAYSKARVLARIGDAAARQALTTEAIQTKMTLERLRERVDAWLTDALIQTESKATTTLAAQREGYLLQEERLMLERLKVRLRRVAKEPDRIQDWQLVREALELLDRALDGWKRLRE